MRIFVIGAHATPTVATCALLRQHGFDVAEWAPKPAAEGVTYGGRDGQADGSGDSSADGSAQSLVQCLNEHLPDAILIEGLQSPCDMSFFRTVQQASAELPIVVLSDHSDPAIAVEFIRNGAQDYLIQGLVSDGSLARCLEYAVERNHLALARHANEMRTQEVLEHAYDAFITTDSLLHVTEWNAAAERAFGWTRAEMLGQSLARIIPRHLQRQFMRNIREYFHNRDSNFLRPSREIIAERRTGQTFPAEFGIFRIDTGSTRAFCAFVRDITTFKRSKEELEQTVYERTERLLRSNEELYQFAKVASHDLQEPLRAVQGFAQLLALSGKGKLDSDSLEFIDYILDGVRRMTELIQSILVHASLTNGDPVGQRTDCNTVMDEVLADLRPAIDETRATFDIEILPDVAVEYSQMVQLFRNLIGNAIKYRGPEAPSISIGARKTMGKWLVSVCDNGIGIEPQYADKIFDMFSRLHSRGQYPGTGIGLAICKKIVTSHGGNIWVESSLGQGSIFMFTLPAIKEKRTKLMNNTIDILLAEDTPSDVRLTQEALKRSPLNYELNVVSDGVEAMEYLNKAKEATPCRLPDIIFLDLNMPKRDGHEVLEDIKKDPVLSPIPVVLLTVSEREEDIMQALRSKMNYYLAKPVTTEKISALIKAICELHSEQEHGTAHTAEETHIRLVLAGNPHTSIFALNRLADDSHHRVRSRLADNPKLTEDLQLKLAQDSHPEVRVRLCENANVTMPVLEQLAKDESVDVRLAVSSSPGISRTLLKMLSEDENVFVCASAKKILAEAESETK